MCKRKSVVENMKKIAKKLEGLKEVKKYRQLLVFWM